MAIDVMKTMAQYAGTRGISNTEVLQLESQLKTPTRQQLTDLKKARESFGTKFTAGSVATEYDRYVGQFGVVGGKVKVVYPGFRKAWKVDSDPKMRVRWGVTSSSDPKAPMFEQTTKTSALPAAIKEKASRFAWAFHNQKYREGQLEQGPENVLDGLSSNHEVKLDTAGKIFDRNHNQVGWIVGGTYKDGTAVEVYYRNDGTFTGMDFSLWGN